MPFDSAMEERIAKAMAAEEARIRREAYLSGNWDLKNSAFLYKDARRIQRAWRRKWGLLSRGRSVNPIQRVVRGFLGRRKAKRRRVELARLQREELLRRCRPRLVSSAPAKVTTRRPGDADAAPTFPRGRVRKRPFSREQYPKLPKEMMFHELRTFFDADYRLHMVRLELRKLLATTKMSLSDLFDKVDQDKSMKINRDELKLLIEMAGCHIKDMEVDYLMNQIDGDDSGEVDLSELSTWYYSKEDDRLTNRRTRHDDDFTDRRVLLRESLRFHPEVQHLMNDLWVMTDLDGSGSINKQEYVILHVQLQYYMLPKGEFHDTKKARKLAEAEWEFDRHGLEEMDKRLFDLAMFQLVDLWRTDAKINNDTFFEAIDEMHQQTTYINSDGSRRWRWVNEDGTGNSSVQRLKEEMLMEAMLERINTQLLHKHRPLPPPLVNGVPTPTNASAGSADGDANNQVAHVPTPKATMSEAEKAWRHAEASAEEEAAEFERQLEQEQLEWEEEERQAREAREQERREEEERRRILAEELAREYEAMKWDGTLAKFKLTGPIKGSLHDLAVAVTDSSLDVFQTGMNYELCDHIGEIIAEEFPRLCRRPLMAFHRPEILMAAEEEIKLEAEEEVPESDDPPPVVEAPPTRYSDMELAMMRLASKEREEAEEREQRELDLRLMRKEDKLSRVWNRPKKLYKKIERMSAGFTTVLKADADGNMTAFDMPLDAASKDLEPLGTPSTAKPMPRVGIDNSHQEYRMQDWGKRPDTTTMGLAEEQLSAMSFGPKHYPKGTTREGALATREFQEAPSVVDTQFAGGREFINDIPHRSTRRQGGGGGGGDGTVFELRDEVRFSEDMSGWSNNDTSAAAADDGGSLTSYLGISLSRGDGLGEGL